MYIQKKTDTKRFLKFLSKFFDVYVPTNVNGKVFYKKFQENCEIKLNELAYYPAKYIIFGKDRKLFSISNKKINVDCKPINNIAIFGLKLCESSAISKFKIVFGEDKCYRELLNRTFLIVYDCKNPISDYCFCTSPAIDLSSEYDMLYHDTGDFFLVEVKSEKAHTIVEKSGLFKKTNKKIQKKLKCNIEINMEDIKNLNNIEFTKEAEICLSCTACTVLCPTCYCFEVFDVYKDRSIERYSTFSSCQLKSFSRIAKDVIERKDRKSRFKHRIMHQLLFFRNMYGKSLCVGCGQCILQCPLRINWIKTIKGIKHD